MAGKTLVWATHMGRYWQMHKKVGATPSIVK